MVSGNSNVSLLSYGHHAFENYNVENDFLPINMFITRKKKKKKKALET